MAAFTGACMARVAGAVIDHLDRYRRERLFQGSADLSGGGFARKRLRRWRLSKGCWLKKVAYHSVSWEISLPISAPGPAGAT
jgi:hypothetical protein